MDDTRIPFQLVGRASQLIVLPVMVDDAGPYRFLLDTGASHTLISPSLATSHGIRAERTDDALGAGGAVTVAHGYARSLSLGAVRRDRVPVAITGEVERVGTAINASIDGALGHDFLGDLVLTLDYDSCTLGLARSEEAGTPDVAFRLASADTPLIVVPVFANGRGPYQFVVDTGASRTCVSQRLATDLGLATTESARGVGGGGGISVAPATLDSLSVGNATVRDHAVGVVTFLDALARHVGEPLDGVIGYNFLNQYRTTIDYPRQTLSLFR